MTVQSAATLDAGARALDEFAETSLGGDVPLTLTPSIFADVRALAASFFTDPFPFRAAYDEALLVHGFFLFP